VGQYWRLGGSGFVESYPDASFHRNHLGSHLTWEIGAMANRGPAAALGATLLLGTDNRGTRLGVKGRYRRWFGSRGGTLDLSGGALKAVAAGSFPDFSRPSYGATADVSLGWGDWVAGTARADLLRRNDGQMVNAAYAGVRLGSYPAVVATVAGAVVVALAIAAFLGGGDF
jgi:hypothetical protein